MSDLLFPWIGKYLTFLLEMSDLLFAWNIRPPFCFKYLTLLSKYLTLLSKYLTLLSKYLALLIKYLTSSKYLTLSKYLTSLLSKYLTSSKYLTLLSNYLTLLSKCLTSCMFRMVSLKVDGLSHRTNLEDLESLFDKYGKVGDVYIPKVSWKIIK